MQGWDGSTRNNLKPVPQEISYGDPMGQLNLNEIFRSYLEGKTVFRDKKVLTEQFVPENVIHREEKIEQIARTLAPALRGTKTSNVFIFGTVGTGKSVSVKHVLMEMQKMGPIIRIIYVNCKMKGVSDTEYRLIAEMSRQMGNTVPSTGLPSDEVYKTFFESIDRKDQSIILVLDEIDALVKKAGDEVLYNLTRINQELRNARVSVIGISNDVSFMDSMDPRVKSSLSEEEIIFPPYKANQIQDILIQRSTRAFNDGVLETGVIPKCSALAAQEHGDARKALDLLRIAGELVEREGGSKITVDNVDRAEDKLDTDKIVEIVKGQPVQSQAVLSAIIKLKDTNQSDVQTGDIYSVYEKICRNRGLKSLTQRRISDLVAELDMLGVINSRVISKGRYGRTREIRIAFNDATMNNIRQILKDNYLLERY
jgi:cell division control protein 6